ncbi:MAG: DNA primase [Bacteroidaceae bacterium]|nr:DNA primase [Bacteroidaceae bacterium]
MTKEKIQEIRKIAEGRELEIIGDYISLTRKDAGYAGLCPRCKAQRLYVTPLDKGRLWRCESCGFKGDDIFTLMEAVTSSSYEDGLRAVASKYNICIGDGDPAPIHHESKVGGRSFCERMLKESGLTYKDVTATVDLGNGATKPTARTFRPGTVNDKGEIVEGDDAIIEYYDLEGKPVTYERKDYKRRGTGVMSAYYRVRWQYPEAHKDKEGNSFKYKSPYGAGTPIYIPQRLRTAYQNGEEVRRLFIQEGEKKAEKACKHGILSFGISGIQNLGYNGALPQDIVNFIRKCKVQEVVFLFDSDWNDLSHGLRVSVAAEKRPNNFFHAAKNFKEYMRGLEAYDLNVEIYIGHTISHNGDKGIDDLLAHTLKGREDELLVDIDHLMTQKVMTGTYVHVDKVSTMKDAQLMRLWGLENVQSFAEMHLQELSLLPEFTFHGHRYRIVNGKAELAEAFDDDEKFWEELTKADRNGNERVECQYSYVNARNFLHRHGFGRYRISDRSYEFVHLEKHFVTMVQPFDVRDYLVTFAEDNCGKLVLEMLLKGSVQYLGPDKLSMLKELKPGFLQPSRECQFFYFRDVYWRVTRSGIEEMKYNMLTHDVWADMRKDVEVTRYPSLVDFSQDENGHYTYTITPVGEMCHFLRFLENTSNFSWRKEDNGQIDEAEKAEMAQHLLSKLCAIGYMSMDIKDAGVTRAVVAMDGKQSEVGESNGRSGKSLVGELMRRVTTVAYIGGKKDKLLDDQFIWDGITEKTRLVFIDDVKQNFDFEMLFPLITGDWMVNHKGGERVTLPFERSPKIYIPTNHAVVGSGSSFRDRQWIILFSDYYNETHKPIDDFGCQFFSEWEFLQWSLTWNLIAQCVQLYLTYGVVQAPGDRAEHRRLRQEITEGFLQWFSEYFSDAGRFGVLLPRSELQEQCRKKTEMNTSPTLFKKRFKKACEYYGWVFNPNMYDQTTGKPFQFDRDGRPVTDYKKGGVEYFMVGTKDGQPPKFDYIPDGLSTPDEDGPF